jgi:hypothetical protein
LGRTGEESGEVADFERTTPQADSRQLPGGAGGFLCASSCGTSWTRWRAFPSRPRHTGRGRAKKDAPTQPDAAETKHPVLGLIFAIQQDKALGPESDLYPCRPPGSSGGSGLLNVLWYLRTLPISPESVPAGPVRALRDQRGVQTPTPPGFRKVVTCHSLRHAPA